MQSPPKTNVIRNRKWATVLLASLVSLAIFIFTVTNPQSDTQVNAEQVESEKDEEPKSQSGIVMPVRTRQVHWERGYEINRRYTGLVQARKKSRLSFENGGTLLQVLVSDGQLVAKDQKLAQLDQRWIDQQLTQAIANLKQQQAVLDEMIKGPRLEVIDATKARLAEANALFEDARIRFEKANSINETGAIISDELDRLRYQKLAAASVIDLREAELSELKAGTRKEQIEAQKNLVASLNSRVEQIKVDLDKTIIRAPFNGQIGEVLLDEGTIAGSGQSIMTIFENDPKHGGLEIWVGIPANRKLDLQTLKKRLWLVHINQTDWEGRTKAILPQLNEVNRTQTLILTLTAKNEEKRQPPPVGSLAAIDLSETVASKGFWAPINALTKSKRGLWSLYQVKDDADTESKWVQRVDVEVLHQTEASAYVRGPINEGASFVADSTEKIVNHQRVSIAPAANTANELVKHEKKEATHE